MTVATSDPVLTPRRGRLKETSWRCRFDINRFLRKIVRGIIFATEALGIHPKDSIMRIWTPLAVVLGLVFGTTGAANAGEFWHSCYVFKNTCESCQQCPNVCHSGGVGCQLCWHVACLDSTCDMYPHYAYYPECHGSYYFRPYNWEHYAQDTALGLGLGPAAPYSEESFHELMPSTIPEQPLIRVRRPKLPNVEGLLRKPEVPPAPIPAQ